MKSNANSPQVADPAQCAAYQQILNNNDGPTIVANHYNDNGALNIEETTERIKQAYAKYMEANTPKVDVFGRPISGKTFINPDKEYSIELQIGNSTEDTVIVTPNGEVLTMATNVKLELDAEAIVPSVTITFLAPKIVSKQTKYNEPNKLPTQ